LQADLPKQSHPKHQVKKQEGKDKKQPAAEYSGFILEGEHDTI